MLGVHRPSRIDAANIEYDEVKKSTADADALVSAYLKEMEVPHAIAEAMMETPPERITVVFIDHKPIAHADVDADVDDGLAYPASIHDWLYAKSKKESDVSWQRLRRGEGRGRKNRRLHGNHRPPQTY